jgi:hypothetical protein
MGKMRMEFIGLAGALVLHGLAPTAAADIVVQLSNASASAVAGFDLDGNGAVESAKGEVDEPPAVVNPGGSAASSASVGGAGASAMVNGGVGAGGATLSVTGRGDCHARVPVSGDPEKDPQGGSGAQGGLHVEFSISKRASFSASASVGVAPAPFRHEGGGQNRARAGFVGTGGTFVAVGADDAFLDPASDAAAASGELEPGTYAVDAGCETQGPRLDFTTHGLVTGPPEGEGHFSLTLEVSEMQCIGPTSRWVGGAAGAFDDPANWDPPEVPSFGDSDGECEEALFDAGRTVDLDLSASAPPSTVQDFAPRAATSHTAGRLRVRKVKNLRLTGGALILDGGSEDRAALIVGGKGEAHVLDGTLQARTARIGEDGPGAVIVEAATGLFKTLETLTIGAGDDGLLQIFNGGTGESEDVRIGDGHHGRADIGDASWTTGAIAVGFHSPGELIVEAGAQVESDGAFVDFDVPAGPLPALGKPSARCLRKGGAGAEVRNASSAWRVDTLSIGGLGCAEVTDEAGIITMGGSPPAGDVLVGTTEAGEGTLLVNEGGVLTVAGNLVVGEGGRGQVVLTEDFFKDPRINVAGAMLIGCSLPPAGRGRVLVDGDLATDSVSLTSSSLRVPDGNTAKGELKITAGGRVTTTTTAEIGTDGTADPIGFNGGNGVVELDGRTVIPVTGADQLTHWQIGESLTIGPASGPGDAQLLISDATVAVGTPPAQGTVTIHNGGAVAAFGQANNLITNGGTILNDGVIQGPVFLGASLDPNSHGRFLAQYGALPTVAAAPLETALSEARAARPPPLPEGPIVIAGDADLSGTTLVLQFLNGFAPRQGDVLPFLEVQGTMTGTFADVEIVGLAPGAAFDVVTQPGMAMSLTNAVALPVVSLKAPKKIKEKTKRAKVKVKRRGPKTAPLTVHYRVGGSAENGIDYATLSGTLEIPAKKSSATLLVKPFVDDLPEPPETIEIEVLPGDDYAPSIPSKVTIELVSTDKKRR